MTRRLPPHTLSRNHSAKLTPPPRRRPSRSPRLLPRARSIDRRSGICCPIYRMYRVYSNSRMYRIYRICRIYRIYRIYRICRPYPIYPQEGHGPIVRNARSATDPVV